MGQIQAQQTQPAPPAGSRRHRRWALYLTRPPLYIVLCLIGILFISPLLWMVSTALKSNTQLAAVPPIWFPRPPLWGNFVTAWKFAPFGTYLRNTVIITVLASLGQVVSATLVGYGFARIKFPFRDTLFIILLSTTMLPYIVTLIPQYIMFRTIGWVDTFLPLIIPYYLGGSPFYIFLLRQYFRTIPSDLSDAARIDGASEWRVFLRVIAPLALPAIATIAIFSVLFHWNDFLAPLIYLTSDSNKTLMLGLQAFIGEHSTAYQYQMGMSALVTAPSVLLFLVFQRTFLRSIVMTGMNG